MRICSICELKNKEVINTCDGSRLGFVSDVELDLDCGKIIAILVPGDAKLFRLSKCRAVRILWCDIDRIGDDVILVRRHEVVGSVCEKC